VTHKTPHSLCPAGHANARSQQDYWLLNTGVKPKRSFKNKLPIKSPSYPEGLTEPLWSRAKLLIQVRFWKSLNEIEATANHVADTIVARLDRTNKYGTPDVLGIRCEIQVTVVDCTP
jgi:hypothetical protein